MKIYQQKVLRKILSLAVLAGPLAVAAFAQIPIPFPGPPYNLPARFEYAAKFVCGFQQVPGGVTAAQPTVEQGKYATVVNIHNPGSKDVTLIKKVVLANLEGSTALAPPSRRVQDTLRPDWAMAVDCGVIVKEFLTQQPGFNPPPSCATSSSPCFIEGFVVIDSFISIPGAPPIPAELDVVAVTTSQVQTPAGNVGSTLAHEVTPVTGRQLPAGVWPF